MSLKSCLSLLRRPHVNYVYVYCSVFLCENTVVPGTIVGRLLWQCLFSNSNIMYCFLCFMNCFMWRRKNVMDLWTYSNAMLKVVHVMIGRFSLGKCPSGSYLLESSCILARCSFDFSLVHSSLPLLVLSKNCDAGCQ